MPDDVEPPAEAAPLLPDQLRRALGWAGALLVGVALAMFAVLLSEPLWDGRARSLAPLWLVAAALAFGATYGVVALSGAWSLKRYLAHLAVVVLGFGLLYLVVFVMITMNTPNCPDTASVRALADLLDPPVGPQSCPG